MKKKTKNISSRTGQGPKRKKTVLSISDLKLSAEKTNEIFDMLRG